MGGCGCGHPAGAHLDAYPGTPACGAARVCVHCDLDRYRAVELIRSGRCPDCGRVLAAGVLRHVHPQPEPAAESELGRDRDDRIAAARRMRTAGASRYEIALALGVTKEWLAEYAGF